MKDRTQVIRDQVADELEVPSASLAPAELPKSMLRQVEFEDDAELPNLLRHPIVRAVYEALPIGENGAIVACNGEYVAAVAAIAAMRHLCGVDASGDISLGLRLRASSIDADLDQIANVEGERWNAEGGVFDH